MPANSAYQPATYIRLDKITYPNGREIGYTYAALVGVWRRLWNRVMVGNAFYRVFARLATMTSCQEPRLFRCSPAWTTKAVYVIGVILLCRKRRTGSLD
ncbi:MAG: hypothetical protein LLG00_08345, partial [Planctomycetaceae bacterium]|nr:hypothetical protein [Planctomycetaceae bacterium]